MPPLDPPPPDGFSDSDQAWYDRLGPAPRPPPKTAAQREGDALKEAMRAYDESLMQEPQMRAALGPEAADQRWQRLQARLDAEGLLLESPQAATPSPRTPAQPPSPPWWLRWRQLLEGSLPGPRWATAAALVLVMGVVVVPLWMDREVYDKPGELKGADDVRLVAVQEPRKAAEGFAGELRRAGLQPGLFQRAKTFVVDIDVEREQLLAATPAFERIGLPVRLGFTRVEFAPQPTR